MKKTIRLTESQLVDLVEKVIKEQTSFQGRILPCKINQIVSDCMKQNNVTGRLLCSPSQKQYAETRFYVVKSGDTLDGILNRVMGLDKIEGYKSNEYKQSSKNILASNPQLKGNPENLRPGDVICVTMGMLD